MPGRSARRLASVSRNRLAYETRPWWNVNLFSMASPSNQWRTDRPPASSPAGVTRTRSPDSQSGSTPARGSRSTASSPAVVRKPNRWLGATSAVVYRELHNLEAGGLVEPGTAGPRDRQPFHVTDAGRRAFATWIARLPSEEIIRFPLLLTVFFREHVEPGRLDRALHELRHLRKLEDYQRLMEQLEDQDSGPAQVLRFGIEYEQAVLRWFASLPGYRSMARAPE